MMPWPPDADAAREIARAGYQLWYQLTALNVAVHGLETGLASLNAPLDGPRAPSAPDWLRAYA